MSAPAGNSAPDSRWFIEKNTELARLAGGLAHEIKNPLSTLTLNLQLLAEDFADAQSQKEQRALRKIARLQQECLRLERILDDFLRFARVTELPLQPDDLPRIVREVADFHAPRAEQDGILLREDLPETLPQVQLERDLFKQAVLNLLLNAHHAMPNGGELILKARADNDFVYLDVIDTGVGMSAETMEKIFDPFFSTRPGGSGLGLPTTKKIIEAHHGVLKVESEPGRGTAFTIQLPIANKP